MTNPTEIIINSKVYGLLKETIWSKPPGIYTRMVNEAVKQWYRHHKSA